LGECNDDRIFKRWFSPAVSQPTIKVFYEGEIIGDYCTDTLVDSKIIVEIKAAK